MKEVQCIADNGHGMRLWLLAVYDVGEMKVEDDDEGHGTI